MELPDWGCLGKNRINIMIIIYDHIMIQMSRVGCTGVQGFRAQGSVVSVIRCVDAVDAVDAMGWRGKVETFGASYLVFIA